MKRQITVNMILIIIVCLLVCNEVIHVYYLYQRKKLEYVHQKNMFITDAEREFSLSSINPFETMVSLNAVVIIIKQGKINKLKLDPKKSKSSVPEQGRYDIRDSCKWTLKNFYLYIQSKQNSTFDRIHSLQLVLQDSTGKIKEAYPSSLQTVPVRPEYRETLGFLSGDTLYATYDYPLMLFIWEALWPVILTLVLTLLFIYLVVSLYREFREERNKGICREQFIEGLVHDLKRPIENQINVCQALPLLNETEKRELLEQNIIQLNDTLHIIHRMLLLSTDAHGLLLRLAEFNLRGMLEELGRPEGWRVNKEFHISVQYEAASPLMVGDCDFLQAVFQNLVDNALKYSGSPADVVIACTDVDSRYLCIEIRDNGQGISAAALKHVFKRYYRGDHQNDRKIKGHGQGLYYARLIIRAHRGRIAIASTPGTGTIVSVTLPKTLRTLKR